MSSHTRKSAYNAIMNAIDELGRIQIHARSSAQPLELADEEQEQLRTALEETRELARAMERTAEWDR